MQNRPKMTPAVAFSELTNWLVFAGACVYLYMLTASNEVQENNTCENYYFENPSRNLWNILYAIFIADYGIRVFVAAFLAKMTTSTVVEVAGKKYMEPETLQEIKQHENSALQTLSTALMIERFQLPTFLNPLKHACVPLAFAPIARSILRKKLHNYPGQTTYQEYRKAYPNEDKKTYALTALEMVTNGAQSAAAWYSFGNFLIDSFYDSTHQNDLPNESKILFYIAGAGMLMGMISVFNEKLQKISHFSADTLQKFYLTAMPLISIEFCSDPRQENPATFMQNGVIPLGILASASMLLAGLHTYVTREHAMSFFPEPRVEDVTEDIENGNIQAPVDYEGNPNLLFAPTDEEAEKELKFSIERDKKYGDGYGY